ncbi:type IV secretion system protein VirB10 [Variovorax sp. J22P271]|uniref:type IV secretion system protein VirB10 n=1 Tax=Variovorax davisae TaxID=3053515 RepID=UPI002578DE4C|nr:type IV secretion system protein VirB10 [Variovorax sp. J22P271]MDM0036762.1 type IV secretion system protein VirB10 [Variovorax sp. J22P271]
MSTHPDTEPQAFEAQPEPESVVQVDRPFRAEVAKRKNTRQLIGGLMLVVSLIALLAAGGFVVKQYREKFADSKATKEKVEREKMATVRQGRDFNVDERLELEEPKSAPQAPQPEPPKAAPAPGGPLPSGFAPTSAGAPLPMSPPPQGQLQGPGPAQQPKPAPPSMMLGGPPDPALAMAQATALAAPKQEDRTVQALAAQKAAGQAPSATAQASAAHLGDRSFVLARGSWIPCILETQLNSTVAGNTSCVVPEDVYSDDGKALLVEKGSHAQGAFGNMLKVGDQRIAVQWARIKTTRGVVIDVDSPATDEVGTTGAGGYVDNHWLDRIGAAVLLSFIEDGMAYAVARQENQSGNSLGGGANVYLPSNTISSTKRLSEKVLESTINIPPTLYKNRGDRIMIFVNRDLWFDSTYKLVKSR